MNQDIAAAGHIIDQQVPAKAQTQAGRELIPAFRDAGNLSLIIPPGRFNTITDAFAPMGQCATDAILVIFSGE